MEADHKKGKFDDTVSLKTSKLSTLSFLLSLSGLLCFFVWTPSGYLRFCVIAFFAVIVPGLSIISLININRNKYRLKGKCYALFALVISSFWILIGASIIRRLL